MKNMLFTTVALLVLAGSALSVTPSTQMNLAGGPTKPPVAKPTPRPTPTPDSIPPTCPYNDPNGCGIYD